MAERRCFLLFLLVFLAVDGCRGTAPQPQPVARAGEQEQAAKASPSPSPAAPPATAAADPPQAEPIRDDSPVVVDPGEEDGKPVSLAEAARAERERRAHAGQPVAVINDKTLPKYAAKGQITVADPKQKKGAADAAASAEA